MTGGWVTQERVCGILAVSRAFGDYEFKGGRSELLEQFRYDGNLQATTSTLHAPPVIASPHVYELNSSTVDEFIIIATDGIWDVMNGSQAVTFVCSHRHTVLKNLGPEGAEEFLASTPPLSVTSDWKSQKDSFVRYGFDAPGATEKVKLYDTYLKKMETALADSRWLVGCLLYTSDAADE